MNSLITAVQFLTILPLKTREMPDKSVFSRAIGLFPLAGLLIGALLAGANAISALIFPETIVNLLLVIISFAVTGGLHADGFADTIDGIYGGSTKEKALAIMRDSRIGTMGALGVVSLFMLKFFALSSIPASAKPMALLLMPVIGRWNMVHPLYLFTYARQEGKAKVFFESMNGAILVFAAVTAAALSGLILNSAGLYLFAGTTAAALGAGLYIKSRIGGLTGDSLGAINEVTETLFLLSLVVIS